MIGALVSSLAFAATASLPVRVDGDGYLRFIRDGRIVYSASATLVVDSGQLVANGLPLTPALRVPPSTVRLEVDLSGNVVAASKSGRTTCGRLVLARFDSKLSEDHGFMVSMSRAVLGSPGEGVFGVIRSTNMASTVPETASAVHTGVATIKVHKVCEIEGSSVTFADIATIEADAATAQTLSAIVFCTAPPVGIDMPITAGRVQALLKRAGIEAQVDVPQGALLHRKYQAITQDEFTAVAIKAAQQSLGVELPMTCTDTQGDFKSPIGQIELKSDDVTASGTNLTVRVGVYVDGKEINSRNVVLKTDASGQVKAGAAVKIVMKSAGIRVEVPGVTRTAGMIGQTVTVVVTQTGSVLQGVVIGVDKIEVKL